MASVASPTCRTCHRALIPAHDKLHRWYCTTCRTQQYLHLPRKTRMADIRNRLAAEMAKNG